MKQTMVYEILNDFAPEEVIEAVKFTLKNGTNLTCKLRNIIIYGNEDEEQIMELIQEDGLMYLDFEDISLIKLIPNKEAL